MKKIIFPLLLSSFLFSSFQLIAQTPWYIGGNAIAATSPMGATTNQAVVFITNGTERGRISAAGNWGFGLSAPTDKVHINSPAGLNPLRVNVNAVTKLLVHNAGGVSIGSGNTPPANGLYVAGRVGIGALAAFSLDVRGTSAFGHFKASAGNAGVIIDKSAVAQNGYLIHKTAGVDRWSEGTYGNDNFSLRNWSLGTNALTVDIANNNVGVGAVSSGVKLNVVGSTTAGGGIATTGWSTGLHAVATSSFSYGVYGTAPYVGVYGVSSYSGYGTYGFSHSLDYRASVGAYGAGDFYGTYGYVRHIDGEEDGGGAGAYGYGEGVDRVRGESEYGDGGSFWSTYGPGLVASNGNYVYVAEFYGAIWSNGGYETSDKNLKKDIREFGDAMSIINKLKPQDYLFKDDAKYASLHLPKGRHYGLLAQDLEQVLPNLVSEAPHELVINQKPTTVIKPTADGKPQPIVAPTKETKETINIKAVNYVELIPIMVKAMQEQAAEITTLKSGMKEQQAEINELKALILKNANGSTATAAAGYLKQNNPNPPLNGNTVIKHFAPNDASNAQILVTDMKGSILKTYKVSNGEGQLTIRTGELPSGTYNYTLYVNNNKIDTKQMIIAR